MQPRCGPTNLIVGKLSKVAFLLLIVAHCTELARAFGNFPYSAAFARNCWWQVLPEHARTPQASISTHLEMAPPNSEVRLNPPMNACGVPVLIGITRSLVKQGDRPQDRRARLSFLEHAARHHVRSAESRRRRGGDDLVREILQPLTSRRHIEPSPHSDLMFDGDCREV
jgi:hypothetical protein